MKNKQLTEISQRLRHTSGIWLTVHQIQDCLTSVEQTLAASSKAIEFLLKERRKLKKEIKRLQQQVRNLPVNFYEPKTDA